jgi:hypothetical protein
MGKKKLKTLKKKLSPGKMTKKKKVLIGAGVAAVAVVGIAGGLFIGKKVYDRHKAGKAKAGSGGGFASREVVDDGPESPALAPYHQPNPKTFTNTAPIPDAVAVGLNYDEDTGAKINLLAACYDPTGANLGYIQAGGQLTSLFNNAIVHTEAAAATTGDDETIVMDLRNVPQNVSQILFGAYLVNPPTSGLPKAFIHMLPMIRSEQVASQEAAGATRSIDYDSDEEEAFQAGSRGIGDEDESDDESLVKLYKDELDNTPFGAQRGFVGGKIFRDFNTGAWYLTPFRVPVVADAQAGIWPALEHYARSV